MRIGIQTWGTEGDVRPFFALAQALQARGHRVRLVYTNVDGRTFDGLATGCGVDALPVGHPYFLTHAAEVAARMESVFRKLNPLSQIRGILEATMDPVEGELVDAAMDLAADSDAVVGHFMAHPAGAAAEKHGRPYVIVSLQPVLPSAHYAPVGAPDLGRLFNPLAWRIVGAVLDSILGGRVNRVRARVGLAPVGSLIPAALEHAVLALAAVSPTLFPRPPDWDERIQVSGFLGITESAEPWEPEADLRAFLDAGDPPAFLGFGSMLALADERALRSVRTMSEAVVLSGGRGVIQAPAQLAASCTQHEAVHFITRAPHSQLFPRCAAVVHHGGAGTTQSVMTAGRPSIVVPHAADQFYWAGLLHARGLAAKPLKRNALSAEALAARIRGTIDDRPMRARAEKVALAVRAEDGPARAAELIERAFGSASP